MNKRIEELIEQATTQKPMMVYNQETGEIEHKEWAGEKRYVTALDSEALVKLAVKECIHIIQRQIVRNGNTPENERSRKHIVSIAERFGISFPIDDYPKGTF